MTRLLTDYGGSVTVAVVVKTVHRCGLRHAV